MILQELARHYEVLLKQEKVFPPGWCQAKVSYALELDREGQLVGVISQKIPEQRGKKEVQVPKPMKVPEMVTRSSGVAANFLCDNAKYLLGIDKDGTNQRLIQCFEAAKELHLAVLQEVDNEAAQAVKKFFLTWKPEKAGANPELSEKWAEVTEGGNLVFLVNHQYAQDNEEIQTAWAKASKTGETGVEGLCLVTGEKTEISRIHSAIKRVQGAQSSGAALVSFNAPAFESYGKEQSYNAPVGKYAMFAYTTALNHLLAQREYVFTMGDTAIVFWSENGEEVYQRTFLDFMNPGEGNREQIKDFFENLQKGREIDFEGMRLNPEEKFYILGLSPNAARLSVRFFYRNTFGKIISNIQRHYTEMEIVRPSWDERERLGVWSLLMETVNQKAREKKPLANMTAAVFEAILSGGKYPENLYGNTLIRIRAEQGRVTRGRAAIIKAYFIRNRENQEIKEGAFVALNENCKNIAYILGREFAVLEAIQQEANPSINTTIKDRYFNSACATPGLVFPVLLKLKENHIRKIEAEGRKIYFEKMLTELQGNIEVAEGQKEAYPKRLSLEEQGMFILGYYHQLQKRFAKKEEQ